MGVQLPQGDREEERKVAQDWPCLTNLRVKRGPRLPLFFQYSLSFGGECQMIQPYIPGSSNGTNFCRRHFSVKRRRNQKTLPFMPFQGLQTCAQNPWTWKDAVWTPKDAVLTPQNTVSFLFLPVSTAGHNKETPSLEKDFIIEKVIVYLCRFKDPDIYIYIYIQYVYIYSNLTDSCIGGSDAFNRGLFNILEIFDMGAS